MLDRKKFKEKVRDEVAYYSSGDDSIDEATRFIARLMENTVTEAYNDGFEDGIKHASEHQIGPAYC